MHMDPAVPNFGRAGRGPVLQEGMALAIEPMLVLGRPQTRLLDDEWTVVTEDGSWAAHFEHTVAITADGPWVLTAPDGGASGFATLAGQAIAGAGPGRRWRASAGAGVNVAYDPKMRASDADRDRVATLLREHHAAGRLTAQEFSDRLDKAFAAGQ